MIELMSELAEEHVSGPDGIYSKGEGVNWKEIGIWTEKQWVMITGKCLSAMSKYSFFPNSLNNSFVLIGSIRHSCCGCEG